MVDLGRWFVGTLAAGRRLVVLDIGYIEVAGQMCHTYWI